MSRINNYALVNEALIYEEKYRYIFYFQQLIKLYLKSYLSKI